MHTDPQMAAQWLAALVESSQDAIISKNLDSIILSWNRAAERLFGYRAEEVIGKPITILFPEERLDEETRILASIRRGERVESYETVRRRKDGSEVEVSLTVSPVRDVQGRIVGASKIARDITERRQAERLQELLIHELRHRVKNILATVQAIARQTFRSGAWDATARDTFEGRLMALSNAHDLISRDNLEGARLAEIVAETLSPYRCERFEIGGPDVRLPANVALSLALALHELATNAAKYGALSVSSGRVAVTWRIDPGAPARLVIRWQERNGPVVSAPQRKGFGSRLIERSLAQEPAGAVEITYDPAGIVCEMSILLPDEPAMAVREVA